MKREINRHPKIGLSLSLCVRDIMDGVVALEDVVVIYSSTRTSSETLDALLSHYRRSYWRKYDAGALQAVLDVLYDQDKVVELRAAGLPTLFIAAGHWATIVTTDEVAAL